MLYYKEIKGFEMREILEKNLEKGLFASRWFIAPVYVILAISLGIITLKVIQEFIHVVPLMFSMTVREVMLFVLHVVDLALVGNLILMIIFAGYENFVSKISAAENSEDKPSWMGKVDFSDLKLKLIASIVAISGINLLEIFMDIESVPDREIQWMIIVHLVFIVSGVLLAVMDFIASKTSKH
jgi:uncharacterized protein (TIGR00645 family)